MEKAITKGVEIGVKVSYWHDRSIPRDGLFLFRYDIEIENKNPFTVQLLRRSWSIFDSTGEWRFVEGEGVVGDCPIIPPGEKYHYFSTCNLNSEIGRMDGHYTMKNLVSEQDFQVKIPPFFLICPGKLN